MDNTSESINLKQVYNIVDWIDLGLVIAIIIYYSRLISDLLYNHPGGIELNYIQFINLAIENANIIGVLLVAASLIVCITFICLTVKMRKRREVGIVRATVRIIWNGIWIPLDVYVLSLILFF